jgi:hypothetical protein
MTGAFSCIVEAMFGKLYGKAMIGRFMKSCDKTFHELLGQHFDVSKFLYFGEVYFQRNR